MKENHNEFFTERRATFNAKDPINNRFRSWLQTPLGQSLIEIESKIVADLTAKVFGYHLLFVGGSPFARGINSTPIPHRTWIHPNLETVSRLSPVIAQEDKLPILSDEIELAYLAHCLEFLPNPHETLREASRVLKPEGHLVISCFNPWSLWGTYRWLTHYIHRKPWDGKFISLFRLRDWLALLGFDILKIKPYYYRPPISSSTWLKKLNWLETVGKWCWPFWGASYVILAKKRTIALIPVREKWRARERAFASGLVEPASSTPADAIEK